MRQLFSAFPSGLAGAALLLFRGALALFVVTAASRNLTLSPWPDLLLDVLAVSLLAGFAVRVIAALLALAGTFLLLRGGCTVPMLLLTQVLNAAAVAMIGPGAFSVDARLYGRSTVRLPR